MKVKRSLLESLIRVSSNTIEIGAIVGVIVCGFMEIASRARSWSVKSLKPYRITRFKS